MISNPFAWPFRGRFLLGLLACAALLGYAFFVQFQQGVQPCNFCILQRVAFAALGLVFLLGALIGGGPRLRRVWVMLAMTAAAAGATIALRHLWVQLYPPPMAGCAASMDYLLQTMPVEGVLRKVLTASGDCSNIDWKFFGLTMPAWTAIWYAALGLWAWAALRAPLRSSRKRHR